jgi:ribosomal-protein-alanine N-acetyltransferase
VSDPAALRSYRERDLPALHALDGVCFPPDIAYTRQELKHFLEHPSAFSIVAEQNGHIAGFAITRSVRRRIQRLGRVAPAVHIITIDVSPPLQRQGLGVQMMEWIIEQASRLGAQALVLEAAVDNRAAHRFYERFGFTVTGTIPGYYNGLVDAFAFERLVIPAGTASPGK